MPGRPQTQYQYKIDDDPLKVANQFGVPPSQLLAANPGGTPFSVGQNINIPFQYSVPVNPQLPSITNQYGGAGNTPYGPAAPTLLQQRMALPSGRVTGTQRLGMEYAAQPNFDMRGRGYGQPTSMDQQYAMRSRGYGQTPRGPMEAYAWEDPVWGIGALPDPTKPYGGFTNDDPDNTDYKNTKAAQYYEAMGTPWLDQTRWDPKRKKYISIRQWLKQSKRGGRRRGGGGGRATAPNTEAQQDYAMANAIIDFGVSAG